MSGDIWFIRRDRMDKECGGEIRGVGDCGW